MPRVTRQFRCFACCVLILIGIARLASAQTVVNLPPPPPPKVELPKAEPVPTPALMPEDVPTVPQPEPTREAPEVQWPWWIEFQQDSLELFPEHETILLVDAFTTAIQNSPDFRILRIDRTIPVQNLRQENAKFDWVGFLDSQWDDRSNPVGSSLDGVQNRKREEQYAGAGGFRRTNGIGGQVEIAQRFGHFNSNSSFFTPQDQGSANFVITYTQPVLRDGGRTVATASIQIAISEYKAANADFYAAFQQRLLSIADTFWNLYRQRAQTIILWQSWQRAEQLQKVMLKRKNIDVDQLQILRAQASASERYSEFINARAEIFAIQESLLKLMYGDRYPEFAGLEYIPVGYPMASYEPLPLEDLTRLALTSRPEIRRAIQQVRIASIDSKVAKNKILPALGLTLAMNAAGLRGNSNIPLAWQDQFSVGEPTYGIGLTYEKPFRNRAALAAHRRSILQLQKRQMEMKSTVSDIALEVRTAGIRANAAIQNYDTRASAWQITKKDMELTEKRFDLLIEGFEVGRLYLDNLLSTQDRLAQSELSLLSAQIESELQRLELERASGTLLERQLGSNP